MSSPPSTLGQYQIIREIARSNDIVYEAYDPLMNRRVAVKELAVPGGATSQQRDERIQRFKREAQAAGTLNHPNIMTVYSFAEDAGRVFMAMEFLDGHTLRNEIDTKGFLGETRAVEIAEAILSGLQHAHGKGVIHRDIKPDNIQLLSSGEIKITDFGIARLTFQPNLTVDGQVFGTPSYMSPEQVVGKDIDARSDLFSIGVLLYEMLSGTKPFAGDSVVSITYAIMNKEPTPPQNASHLVWEVVRRALEKSPAARYAGAAEMLKALQDATRPEPDPVATSAPPSYAYSAPVPPPVYGTLPVASGATYAPYVPGGVYGNPAVQPPSPYTSAPTYGANPYASPYPPATLPPPGPLPVYFPPPPRAPLLKPETSAFLQRLLVTVVVVGTLFALVAAGVMAIAQQVTRMNAERMDERVRPNDLAADPRVPLPERIAILEEYRARLSSSREREKANRELAALYEQQGKEYVQRQDEVRAEGAFLNAVSLDPYVAAPYTNLGALYESRARAQSDDALRADLWRQAGEQWSEAAERAVNGEQREQYRQQAAANYYNFASEVARSGDPSRRRDARFALYEARERAVPGSQLAQEIQDLLSTIR